MRLRNQFTSMLDESMCMSRVTRSTPSFPPEPFCPRQGVLLTSISLQYEWRSSANVETRPLICRSRECGNPVPSLLDWCMGLILCRCQRCQGDEVLFVSSLADQDDG